MMKTCIQRCRWAYLAQPATPPAASARHFRCGASAAAAQQHDEAQGGDLAATTERRRWARWMQIGRRSCVRPLTCSTLSVGFPLAAAVLQALRADSPDMLKGTNRRWRVHIAFALADGTWAAGADVVHSALHVDVHTWIRLQSVAATASHLHFNIG